MIPNAVLHAVSFLRKMAMLPGSNHGKHLLANFIFVLHILLKAKQRNPKTKNKTRLDGRLRSNKRKINSLGGIGMFSLSLIKLFVPHLMISEFINTIVSGSSLS